MMSRIGEIQETNTYRPSKAAADRTHNVQVRRCSIAADKLRAATGELEALTAARAATSEALAVAKAAADKAAAEAAAAAAAAAAAEAADAAAAAAAAEGGKEIAAEEE
jgi:hypothetical protein